MPIRSILLTAAMLVGPAVVAQAQTPYRSQQPYPGYAVPATPQSWSYDPYTNGSTACVQSNWGNLPHCNEFISPTYGQPNYWPAN